MSEQQEPTFYAQHIRGRVHFMRGAGTYTLSSGQRLRQAPLWRWQVINTKTGALLASDNGCLPLERMISDCAEAVEIARRACFWGFERKALR